MSLSGEISQWDDVADCASSAFDRSVFFRLDCVDRTRCYVLSVGRWCCGMLMRGLTRRGRVGRRGAPELTAADCQPLLSTSRRDAMCVFHSPDDTSLCWTSIAAEFVELDMLSDGTGEAQSGRASACDVPLPLRSMACYSIARYRSSQRVTRPQANGDGGGNERANEGEGRAAGRGGGGTSAAEAKAEVGD